MDQKTIGGMSDQGLPFSKAVRAGDFVYVSGQVAFDSAGNIVLGGIREQTIQTMRNIESVLEEAGCSLADVIKVNVWLEDARDFGIFNKTYATFFPQNAPARSTVESNLMIAAKIEVDCIAYKPE